MQDLTYCEQCLENKHDEAFDYRFDFPICQDCVYELNLTPELIEGEY